MISERPDRGTRGSELETAARFEVRAGMPSASPASAPSRRDSGRPQPADERQPRRRVLEVRPTLVVGVGGTGALAVKHVKSRVRELSSGHDASFVRYVVLDTTTEDPSVVKLGDGEFVNIGHLDFNAIVSDLPSFEHLASWFPQGRFKPMQLGLGAMGVRHIGRLCYFQWRESSRVRDHIVHRIQELMNPRLADDMASSEAQQGLLLDQSSGMDIHVISSGAGGTGSGMLLDAAFDLRRWAKTVSKSARVIGHVILPDAFEGLVPEPVLPQAQANSHALLSELDHFLAAGGWDVRYKSERVRTDDPPFDLIYLLGRGGLDGAARSRDELVAMVGSVVACMTTTPAGKDLLDCAVNLIPPILSGVDAQYQRPCAYASYGVSIGVAYRDELLEQGTLDVALALLAAVDAKAGPDRAAQARALLAEARLAWDDIERLRPEDPPFTFAAQPVSFEEAEALRENQHAPRVAEYADACRRDWLSRLEDRSAPLRPAALMARLRRRLLASDRQGDDAAHGERLGDLAATVSVLIESVEGMAERCDARGEELRADGRRVQAELREIVGAVAMSDALADRYRGLVTRVDRAEIGAAFYSQVHDRLLELGRDLRSECVPALTGLRRTLALITGHVRARRRAPRRLPVPFTRFVSNEHLLARLHRDLGTTEARVRRAAADALEESARDLDELPARFESFVLELAATTVDSFLSRYDDEHGLDLAAISGDFSAEHPEAFATKLHTMYSLAQPALRSSEGYPKEKIVTLGRVTSDPADPAAELLRDVDRRIHGFADRGEELSVLRFVYGLPLWAIEGVAHWEANALELQAREGVPDWFLDPRWAARIRRLVPRSAALTEDLWLFTSSWHFGRVAKPVDTWEFDGERLRGVRSRRDALVEFRRRLDDGRLAREALDEEVENRLREKGDHDAQLRFLRELRDVLDERVARETAAGAASVDAPTLRDEIAVLEERIERKRRDV